MNVGLRQAALALSSLDPEDRVWLLGQLSDSERELLKTTFAPTDENGVASSMGREHPALAGMRSLKRSRHLTDSGIQSSVDRTEAATEGVPSPASRKGVASSNSADGEAKPVATTSRGPASKTPASKTPASDSPASISPASDAPDTLSFATRAPPTKVPAACDTSAFAQLQDQLALAQRRSSRGHAIADASDLSSMLQLTSGSGAVSKGRRDASAARQRVIHARSREIFVVLSAEPDWMVAAICGLHRWQWLTELFQLFGNDRTARIKALVRAQPEHGAGVRDALIELLGARLLAGGLELRFDAGAEGVTRGAPRRGRLGRVFGRLANWLL